MMTLLLYFHAVYLLDVAQLVWWLLARWWLRRASSFLLKQSLLPCLFPPSLVPMAALHFSCGAVLPHLLHPSGLQ